MGKKSRRTNAKAAAGKGGSNGSTPKTPETQKQKKKAARRVQPVSSFIRLRPSASAGKGGRVLGMV